MPALQFVFRKPRLPAIIDTGSGVLGVTNWATCKKSLATIALAGTAHCDVIDATAEGFTFYPQLWAISPLTMKKRWNKAAIINLYNNARGPACPAYPTTSLSNKSLEKVISDIVELLVRAGTRSEDCGDRKHPQDLAAAARAGCAMAYCSTSFGSTGPAQTDADRRSRVTMTATRLIISCSRVRPVRVITARTIVFDHATPPQATPRTSGSRSPRRIDKSEIKRTTCHGMVD